MTFPRLSLGSLESAFYADFPGCSAADFGDVACLAPAAAETPTSSVGPDSGGNVLGKTILGMFDTYFHIQIKRDPLVLLSQNTNTKYKL